MSPKKIIPCTLIGITLVMPFFASAQIINKDTGRAAERLLNKGLEKAELATGSNIEFAKRIGNVINLAIGIFGVVLLGLLIYAGYLWTNARGNEEEVTQAKNIIKEAVIGLFLVFIAGGLATATTSFLGTETLSNKVFLDQLELESQVSRISGLKFEDFVYLQTTAARIINFVLGLLGVIALCLFIYAGYLWLSAGGNEEKVSTAKSLLSQTITGFLVVFVSATLINIVLQMGPIQEKVAGLAIVAKEVGLDVGTIESAFVQFGRVLNFILGLIGVIILVLYIYAGYLWASAGGNEEKVGQAKKIFAETILATFFIFVTGIIVSIALNTSKIKQELAVTGLDIVKIETDLQTGDIIYAGARVGSVLNFLVGMLGLVAFVLILYSGYLWATAAGNEEQVTKARRILIESVGGMTLVFLTGYIVNIVLQL